MNEISTTTILQWIINSLDSRPEIRCPAEQSISTTAASTAPGIRNQFLLSLLSISSHKTLQFEIRLASILCFKRALDAYTTPPSDSATSSMDEIKSSLLRLLLDGCEDEITASQAKAQLSIQCALCIARIARADFPWRWPQLLSQLTEASNILSNSNEASFSLSQKQIVGRGLRAFRALNYVAKSIASRRLPGAMKFFRSISTDLLNLARNGLSKNIAIASDSNSIGMEEAQQATLICSKLARTALLLGVVDWERSNDVRNFLTDLISALLSLSSSFNQKGISSTPPFIISLLYSLSKTVMKAQKKRPHEFAPFVEAFLQFFWSLAIQNPFSACASNEKLLVISLRFIKNVTQNSSEHGYRLDLWRPITQPPPQGLLDGDKVIKKFFTSETIRQFVISMVQVHFVLTQEELNSCINDPEAFTSQDEEVNAWKFTKRSCAENVFMSVLERFPSEFILPLTELLSNALQVQPNDLNSCLLKDAIYTAVGLGSFELVSSVKFEQTIPLWITELQKVQQDRGLSMILKRRVAWLLGNVMVVGMEQPPLSMAYQCLSALIVDQELSVAFAAASSLRSLVDNILFSGDDFSPFALQSLSALFTLLLERTQESSSRMRILHVIVTILQQVGKVIIPHSLSIAQGLARLWMTTTSATNESAIRTQILSAMSNLVNSIGSIGIQSILTIVLPLIVYSRSAECIDAEVLLEDSLDLWKTVMLTTPEMTDDILNLCNLARLSEVFLQTTDSDRLISASSIASSYIICFGNKFLMLKESNDLFEAINKSLDGLNDKGISCVLKPLISLFRLPKEIPLPISVNSLLLKLVLSVQTNQQNQSDEEEGIEEGKINELYSLAKCIARDSGELLLSLCKTSTGSLNLLSGVATSFVFAFDSIGSQKIRKTIVIALCDLIPICFPYIDVDEIIGTISGSALSFSSLDRDTFMEESYEGNEGSLVNKNSQILSQQDVVLITDACQRLVLKVSEANRIHGETFDKSFNHQLLIGITK